MLRPLSLFLKNSLGLIVNPYVTIRELSIKTENFSQILFIHFFVFLYFFLSSIVKTGLHNPYFLTLKFNSLYLASYFGFALMIALFFLSFKLLKSHDFFLVNLIVLWSYSLWPTLLWFFFTSILYLLLPPPRTFSYPGKIYSLFYLSVSLTLLFWKFILYYLTLRFGLKFDLVKIIVSSSVIFPFVVAFSWLMYRLSVFKIPFI